MISFPIEIREGVVAPTWLPGTTKFKVFDGDAEYVIGTSHVGRDVGYASNRAGGAYDAVEHLIFVDGPRGAAQYPYLTPRLGGSHGGELFCGSVEPAGSASELIANAQKLFAGRTISYVVAGVDYFLGRPQIGADPLPGQSRWVDDLTLDYLPIGANQPFQLLGFVFAEAVDGVDFLVHQCNYNNLELSGNMAGTLRPSLWNGQANLREYFKRVKRMLPTGTEYLYARAYARRVQRTLDVADLHALASPPERWRLPEDDDMRDHRPYVHIWREG